MLAGVLMGFQHSDLRQFDSWIFQQDFDRWVQWIGDIILSLISENTRLRFMLALML